jgi:hypothetical protein
MKVRSAIASVLLTLILTGCTAATAPSQPPARPRTKPLVRITPTRADDLAAVGEFSSDWTAISPSEVPAGLVPRDLGSHGFLGAWRSTTTSQTVLVFQGLRVQATADATTTSTQWSAYVRRTVDTIMTRHPHGFGLAAATVAGVPALLYDGPTSGRVEWLKDGVRYRVSAFARFGNDGGPQRVLSFARSLGG